MTREVLDYGVYVDEGDLGSPMEDYDSASADLLDLERMKALLVTVPEVRTEMARAGRSTPDDLAAGPSEIR